MILFIASVLDKAGVNIANKIVDLYDFKPSGDYFHDNPVYVKEIDSNEIIKLIWIKDEPVNAQYIDKLFKPKLVVFLSRHSSKSGIPTLSVHTPGNFKDASLGGLPNKLSISPANAMRNALVQMAKGREEYGLKYEVSYECTHHGPSLDLPTMFVELGSTERQWLDEQAATVVATAAVSAVKSEGEVEAVLGIGGPHYNMKFTKLALKGEYAFGHMIPNYAIPKVDLSVVKQCVSRTLERVEKAVLDWKGIKGSFKNKLLNYLSELDLKVVKV